MPNLRYEKKFASLVIASEHLQLLISNHPLRFTQAFPDRTVNNIYFDSPGFTCFYDHVNGVYERFKMRIRWYGSLYGFIEKPVLEIKIKRGLTGKKLFYSLPSFQFDPTHTIAWQDLFSKANFPDFISDKLRSYYPALCNTYHRKYFSSHNKMFRITLDSELCYYRPSLNGTGSFAVNDPLRSLLELKYDTSNEEHADIVSINLPMPLVKNSKYVRGITLLYNF